MRKTNYFIICFFRYKEIIIKTRELCVEILDQVINKDKFSNEAINENLHRIDHSESGFLRQLVYGVVENLFYLDYILQKLSKNKLTKLDKDVLNILRMAIYELHFLNSKTYAVINEAVNICKKKKFSAKGFVNGILRNFDRNREELVKVDIVDIDQKLSILYSCDIEIIKYLKKYYDNYKEIVESFNQVPAFSIRVNERKISKVDLMKSLSNKFSVKESELAKGSLIIENPVNVTNLDEFKQGLFTIQDQSSILVAEILDPQAGAIALDLCAAPGSKSSHILQLMDDKGKLVANDIASNKLEKIKENLERMDLKNYEITNYDGTDRVKEFENSFDYILVDAPCSGLGVIKRKPEIKIKKSIKDIESLAAIQEKILENAYYYLKPGGKIVYSTCSLGKMENDDIVERFLNLHDDIRLLDGNNPIQILPNMKNDGFYIAAMIKD